jgi:7-carboxy-7-deazaguanine synthase
MTAEEIVEQLLKLNKRVKAPWIVITGGNPALHDLSTLVDLLHEHGWLVSVETQGSKWRDWLRDIDRLCLSPKPPSANVKYQFQVVQRFFNEALEARASGERDYHWLFLKIPIFDLKDLEWVVKVRKQLSDAILYLSAGNDASRSVGAPTRRDLREIGEIRRDLLIRARKLIERTYAFPELCSSDVFIQTQFHVLLWGNEKGR